MQVRPGLWLVGCIVLVFLCAGCISLSVGTVSYATDNLSVTVNNGGDPLDAGLQVRIFETDGVTQHERDVIGMPVSLGRGTNTLLMPVKLEPGTYKLYVYLTVDGNRQTAVIRDITV